MSMRDTSKRIALLLAVLVAMPTAAHTQQPAATAAQGANAKTATVDPKSLPAADQLLALAQKLKETVDKTQKYELSVTALKQLDEIEKLAKSAKDQIKP